MSKRPACCPGRVLTSYEQGSESFSWGQESDLETLSARFADKSTHTSHFLDFFPLSWRTCTACELVVGLLLEFGLPACSNMLADWDET